jgi:hypothetical protein
MASKRKGKEVEGSGSGTGKRQVAVQNQHIEFKDADQRNRYKTLVSKTISSCRYTDSGAMNTLGIRDNVVRLLNNLGMSCLCCGLC